MMLLLIFKKIDIAYRTQDTDTKSVPAIFSHILFYLNLALFMQYEIISRDFI